MASVRRIAQKAGVSIATVSRVLNNDPAVSPKTRERVLSTANASGYVPSIGRRVTSHIGFTFAGRSTLADAFDSAVLRGVSRGVNECRLDILLLDIQRDKERDETYTHFFMRKGVRGVILRTTAETREVCRAIADEGFPHVVISDRFDEPNVNYIDGESKADCARAVEYLITLGHQRIAFGMHSVPDRDHLDRYEAYKEALDEHGITLDERLVYRYPINLAAGASIMKLTQSMVNRPTAIFFADSLPAIGAVKKAQEMQVRIPQDLSIVGFDDAEARFGVHPTLTAVCQDAARLGFEAAAWLMRRLTGAAEGEFRKSVPTFFEVNQSTAPPA